MEFKGGLSRRHFLTASGAVAGTTFLQGWPALAHAADVSAATARVGTPRTEMAELRRQIIDSPLRVALHRAKTFTKVFQKTDDQPWIVRKAMALREYFETVPLYLRPHDGLVGSMSELPGAMPIMVELGIGENSIYVGERPDRKGYLKGQVPKEIREYWKNRNLWGYYRTEILGQRPAKSHDELPAVCPN